MAKLTEEQIKQYEKERNPNTGVDGITREFLESIDTDNLPQILDSGTYLGQRFVVNSDGQTFTRDRFTPRAGTVYFKPSYAGRQVILGVTEEGNILFSNGVWFSSYVPREDDHNG